MNTAVRSYSAYRICGLRIGSAIPFPELPPLADIEGDCSPDIEFDVENGILPHSPGEVVMTMTEPDGALWLSCTKTNEGYRFNFPDLADFLVDRTGRRVNCVAPPDTPAETIRHLFLDQVIPPLLNLRGREALHASAIQTKVGACAFVGESGRGKSTLAAAFHAIGYPVLCDDCLLLKEGASWISVEPAYPGLRLWDDSRRVVFGDERSTQPVSHYTSKMRIATPGSGAGVTGIFPLRGIFSLRRHESADLQADPVIEPLSVRDAFMELIEFAFRLDLSDRAMLLRQMQFLERVAAEVPVKRLRLPDDLRLLPAACEMILRDLERGRDLRCA